MQCSYNACMVTITIRNVPEEARDVLAGRAANSGRSLQEYLRGLLVEWSQRPDVGEIVERMERRTHALQMSLSADEILAARDADRR